MKTQLLITIALFIGSVVTMAQPTDGPKGVAEGNNYIIYGNDNGALSPALIRAGGATSTKGGNLELISGSGGTSEGGDVIITANGAQNKGGNIILTPGLAASGSGKIVFNVKSAGVSFMSSPTVEVASLDVSGKLTIKSLSLNNNINDKIFFKSGNVGIGTQNPSALLTVNGKIEAKDIEVKNVAADFVFAPDYKLASLEEVELYIKANGHLPGVAPAEETAKGVELGKFNTLLLQKIEELTLYTIELQKRVAELEARNQE